MIDGLLLAWMSIAWGAQAVVPARLGDEPTGRRRWGYAVLPLLLTGAIAGVLYFGRHPDAALATHLVPLGGTLSERLLLVLFVPLLAAALMTALGSPRMEAWSLRIAAGFGATTLIVVCWIAESLRQGEGPESPGLLFFFLVLCRLTMGLAAGEIVAPGRPSIAPVAAACLPIYLLLLPPSLRSLLAPTGQLLTLGTGAALLLSARWLPPSLRRAALLGGILLASLFIGQIAGLSNSLGSQPLPPLPPLPGR